MLELSLVSVEAFTLSDEVCGEASQVATRAVGEAVLRLAVSHGTQLAAEVAVLKRRRLVHAVDLRTLHAMRTVC